MKLAEIKVLKETHDFEKIKKNRTSLTPEERETAKKAGATWEDGSIGVWKSKDSKGNVVYCSNTHRACSVKPTLKAAIKAFEFIKSTS